MPPALPLALTVVAPPLLVPFEPEVPALALAPPCPGLSLDRVCEAPDDPPYAVDISEPDDL